MKRLLFVILLCIYANSSAFSQDRFVSITGDDTGPNDCSLSGSPCLTIQNAINQAVANDIIAVASGTYRENITISKSVILQGSNNGTSGFGTRGAESIIQPASTDLIDGRIIIIEASNVEVNGFTINGNNSAITGGTGSIYDALQGIYLDATSSPFTNVSILNNIIEDFPRENRGAVGASNTINGSATIISAGILIEGSASGTNNHTVSQNLFRNIDDEPNADYTDNLGYGLALITSAYAEVSSNNFDNVGGGILIVDIPKETPTDSLRISNCNFEANKAGIVVTNGPTNVTVDNAQITNSVGFGIRVLMISGSDDLDFYLTNSTITETGNALSNYSGLASEAYAGSGTINVNIENSTISDNKNRGVTLRGIGPGGNNVGTIKNSIIEGNAYDGALTGGGVLVNAYGIIINRGAVLTISESVISNSSVNRTATVYNAVIGNDEGNGMVGSLAGGTLNISSCAITATTGNLILSSGTGSSANAAGNWWGSTTESDISTNMDATVDFSPWLNSGVDQDLGTMGFQASYEKINVGLGGSQLAGLERIEEGISFSPLADTIVIHGGTYAENPTFDRDLVVETVPAVNLDMLTMNGAGNTLTVNGNLAINTSLNLTDGLVNINSGSTITLDSIAFDFAETTTSRVLGNIGIEPINLLSTESIDFLGANFVSGNNDLSNLSISRITGPQGQNVDGGGQESINVTWQLTADSPPDNWLINFSWSSIYDNGNGLSSMLVWRNGGTGWSQIAGPLSATGDPRVTENFAINSFSDYTVTDETVLLPVTLESFNAKLTAEKNVDLLWTTLTEVDADLFQVEKSNSGENFYPIGNVTAVGNSVEREEYTFTDFETSSKEAFYRLKMVDLDGSYEYSKITYIQLSEDLTLIYPNPASTFLTIPISGVLNNNLTLFDQAGRKVMNTGLTKENVDVSNLSAGVYFFLLKKGDSLQKGKLIIE